MYKQEFKLASSDVVQGIKMWRIWLLLGWQDIRLRYRRSHIGPFWITISTAIMIYSMGFLYGRLFKVDLSHYYIFLASGLITWTLISTIIIESSDAFMEAQEYIKQIKLPYTLYIMRILTRNFIVFLHNLLPIIPIIIYMHVFPNIISILFGVLVILLCGVIYGLLLAIMGTRYRDIKQIINSLVQIIFLLTPIMWNPDMLPEKYRLLANLNPFTQLISPIRAGMIGKFPTKFSFFFAIGLLLFGTLLSFILLARSRRKIAFWI